MTVQVDETNVRDIVQKPGIALLDFWAQWCGPCRAFAPIFERASARQPELVFGKVNTEEVPSLARAFGIQAIPTLLVFRDGVLLFAQPGVLPEAALDRLIGDVRALDMEVVRRDLKARRSAS